MIVVNAATNPKTEFTKTFLSSLSVFSAFVGINFQEEDATRNEIFVTELWISMVLNVMRIRSARIIANRGICGDQK